MSTIKVNASEQLAELKDGIVSGEGKIEITEDGDTEKGNMVIKSIEAMLKLKSKINKLKDKQKELEVQLLECYKDIKSEKLVVTTDCGSLSVYKSERTAIDATKLALEYKDAYEACSTKKISVVTRITH